MIRPYRFLSNPQTQNTNSFQDPDSLSIETVSRDSIFEFDQMVSILKNEGVRVLVFQDPGDFDTPDSLFPNNWISFHETGLVVLFPMEAKNRRLERRWNPIRELLEHNGFKVQSLLDLSQYESQAKFLEGTGSMVLDRDSKLAYACISPRTHKDVLEDFCGLTGYAPVHFHAFDRNHMPIYHTNVMMCVGTQFVLICLDSIFYTDQRIKLQNKILKSGKTLIEINLNQMEHFAGNMLEVLSQDGNSLIILSEQAYKSLNSKQIQQLSGFGKLVPIPLKTIEKNGGGSARCMMAEVHLPN